MLSVDTEPASGTTLWDRRATFLATAVLADTELAVPLEEDGPETGLLPAGGTVALLRDGLHCVFANNDDNVKLL